MLCAVSFTRNGRLYYLDPGPYTPRVGDKVLVPTDDGPEVAECVWPPTYVSDDIAAPVLAGLAGEADLARDAWLRQRKAEVTVAARRLIREHDLPMKLVAVDYVAAARRATVYFTAPHRVDFRALVRDLAGTLDCKVELRQLSARDQAKATGGIGPCGRELCCATFLAAFEPVSVRMAKDQDLSLNPLHITGACGRLMCCLKYEHPLYAAFKETAPPVGEPVRTPDGPGRVVGHDAPREQLTVRLDDGGARRTCALAAVCSSRQAFETGPAAAGPGPAAAPGADSAR